MPEGSRRTERDLDAKLEQLLPSIAADLFTAVARAIAVQDTVDPPTNIRMADAARWIQGAEGALDVPQGSLLNAIARAQNEMMVDRVQNDPVVVALERVIADKPFEGTVGELLARMMPEHGRVDKFFPPTPSHLSKALTRLKPAMKRTGITITPGPKTKLGKTLRISREGSDAPKVPPYAK